MVESQPRLFAPIKAERYRDQARLSEFIAPPYDVLSRAEREAFASRSPYNIVHLTLPEGRPTPYVAAAKVLARWRAEGALVRESAPIVYVVQQEFLTPDGRRHVRTGVMGGLWAEDYDSGRVRPHEQTHGGPKEDRLALGRATRCAPEPIFVLSRDVRGHLRRRLEGVTKHEPMAVADFEGGAVGVWRVRGLQAEEIARAVGEGPVYIADGHHRYETASNLRLAFAAADRIPALVVPMDDPGVVVLPTHRVIVSGRAERDSLVALWKPDFVVEERETELDPGALLDALGPRPAAAVVFPDGHLVTVVARQDHGEELEIAVIERDIIQPMLVGAKVEYTASPAALIDAVNTHGAIGVMVRPTPVDRVLAVADAGETMPPKSTYFVPKVPSGLLILPFDEAPPTGEEHS
jgi:uncharacterized protein (DUF1015 family)